MADEPRKDDKDKPAVIPDHVTGAQAIYDHLSDSRFLAPGGKTMIPVGTVENGKTIVRWTQESILQGDKPFEPYQIQALKKVLLKLKAAAILNSWRLRAAHRTFIT
jgi:hypothetical protein